MSHTFTSSTSSLVKREDPFVLGESWADIQNSKSIILEQATNSSSGPLPPTKQEGVTADESSSLQSSPGLPTKNEDNSQYSQLMKESEIDSSFVQDEESDIEPSLDFTGLRSELFDDFSLEESEIEEKEEIKEVEVIKKELIERSFRARAVGMIVRALIMIITMYAGATVLYLLTLFNFISFLQVPLPIKPIPEPIPVLPIIVETLNQSTAEDIPIPNILVGNSVNLEIVLLTIFVILSFTFYSPRKVTPKIIKPEASHEVVSVHLPHYQSSLQSGIRLYHTFQPTQSKIQFLRALQGSTNSLEEAVAYTWLGHLSFRTGSYLLASEHYFSSIRCDSSNAINRACWGKTLFKLGDYGGAVKQLLMALEQDGEIDFGFEFLGKSLHRLGQFDEAESTLNKAIELNPDSYAALAFLGYQNYHLGKTILAKRLFERALEKRCDLKECWLGLGLIGVKMLDSKKSNYFQAAIEFRDLQGDEDLLVLGKQLLGVTPFLLLYFSMINSSDREQVLVKALSLYGRESLLSILSAIQNRQSTSRKVRNEGIKILIALHKTNLSNPLRALVLCGLGRINEGRVLVDNLSEVEKKGNYRFIVAGMEECVGLAVVR